MAEGGSVITADDTASLVLVSALVIVALLLTILRRFGLEPECITRFDNWLQKYFEARSAAQRSTWRKVIVAIKVEFSVVRSNTYKLQFLGELAILGVIAFLIAEIVTSARFVRDGAFAWLVIGLPTCLLLGRVWWRKYR